jgi:3-oxoadipate CoA-transferase beta subunit
MNTIVKESVKSPPAYQPLSRRQIAERLARDIPEGWYVNLGIGAPLQVADYVPAER